jgi:hypothetical protein
MANGMKVCVLQAVNKKYAQSKFLKISCRPELESAAFKRLAAS